MGELAEQVQWGPVIDLKSIDHICLWVRSLNISKEYYEKLFSVVCFPREGDENTLVVESRLVHFFISENKEDVSFIKKQHLSFEVEDLTIVTKYLTKLEIDYSVGEAEFFKNRNYKWCEWRDPDGIRLECVEAK